jgi:SAM-dependent methyltransferase
VWGALKDDHEIRQKAEILRQTIPETVSTILDVGCGDGAITNRLAEHYQVTGVDSSAEALNHVRTDAILADATSLPFDDASFDLVLSSELLEHLDDAPYRAAIAEMSRVASRHLLITVPYLEDLRFRIVRCPRCGHRGHVWGHRRRFSLESLAGDLPGFQVVDARIFGPDQPALWPSWSLWILHNLLRSFYWAPGQHPLCERCGNTDYSRTRAIHPVFVRAKNQLDAFARRPRLPFWLAILAERAR